MKIEHKPADPFDQETAPMDEVGLQLRAEVSPVITEQEILERVIRHDIRTDRIAKPLRPDNHNRYFPSAKRQAA